MRGLDSCLPFCIPKALLCLPLFMVHYHLRQEPLLNIVTSFSGYCSQDVTAMLVESVGGDSLRGSGWARAELNTKPVSHHRTSSHLDCCSPLFASTLSLSHMLHSILLLSYSPWSYHFRASSLFLRWRQREPSHHITFCLCQPISVSPLFSHSLLKALLHSTEGYCLCTLLFFQSLRLLVTQI